MKLDTLAILGVGLLGGSVALAARRRGVSRHVVGFEPDEGRRQHILTLGLVDEATTAVDDLPVTAADLVVCCAPVDRVAGLVLEVAGRASPGLLLTDVGSTKAEIVAAVEARLPEGARFVGGHPLAGSEKAGPEHADGRLFEGRVVILTPTERTPDAATRRVTDFWESLGARVVRMSPAEHDRAVAWTSHLPHVAASALAGLLPAQFVDLAASGFRDTTRVAAGDPALWSAICLQNRTFLLEALKVCGERLDEFARALEAGDGARLQELLDQGRRTRREMDAEPSPPAAAGGSCSPPAAAGGLAE